MASHKARLIDEAKKWLRHEEPGEAFFRYFAIVIREAIANKAITDALVGSRLDKDEALRPFLSASCKPMAMEVLFQNVSCRSYAMAFAETGDANAVS